MRFENCEGDFDIGLELGGGALILRIFDFF